MNRKSIVVVTALVCALVFALVSPFGASLQETRVDSKIRKAKDPVPGRYIVVLEDWAAGPRGFGSSSGLVAWELGLVYGGRIDRVFSHAINGYSAELAMNQVEALSRDYRVKYIEEDGEMTITAVQSNATWGLDRIDQRDLPLNGTYQYDQTGAGVSAYIIDTGIRASHNDFGGRVSGGFTAINDGRGTNDCNGHGTHVAGTTGGSTWGVAKSVSLVPVRVLNCQGSGTTSGVIAGVEWVTANHVKPAVANMSLGGGVSTALDTAVSNSINAGVTYAVSAGNSNANACNYSPARVGSAITVGATTNTDSRASYSNFGNCVDLFAPGSSITSSWHTNNNATNTISGTSMASPHVAGVAALYLQLNPDADPAAVVSAIVGNATSDVVIRRGTGSPNLLLFSLFGGGPTPTPTPAPSPTSSPTPEPTPTASPTPAPTIGLSVSMSKVKGVNFANLSWSGSIGTTSVIRSGSTIASVSGTSYQDDLGRGGGSQTYQVCDSAGCSNIVTVSY